MKGSRLTGDINISYDLELDGTVEGNITSDTDSNIIIRGSCNGSIRTRGGNVSIEGEMMNGDIFAGGDVKITGKFTGGKVEARGKIYINGEFRGKLESSEIAIGPQAKGKGDMVYKEFISIEKGARVEAHITRVSGEQKGIKKSSQAVEPSSFLTGHGM
ncbi:MAG: polymer-forming cytoskeletal protein [bacterium]